MTDRDSARAAIADLVRRFLDDRARGKLTTYNEDQTRHYYILPLFRALGWDTSSPAEFTAEEQISRGFVDFGFYLNNVPAFYLETKRVTERLGKPENMRQSINYAYLRGVTWAVLTDFEELMVFNADWEEKDPLKTRFLHLKAEDYAGDGFEDLWLLSKPAMSQSPRAIDRTAERYGKKDKKQPVTELIYRNLTEWRAALFKQIRQLDDTLWASDATVVDNAVQKLFDRLIFLRSVEDRGIEPPRLQPIVRAVGPRGNPWPPLMALFRDMDGVYNSNLFESHHIDSMTVHDPGLVQEIINGLYTIGGVSPIRLDFNAISADVLGRVYEQYLAFKADDPEAKTTTKSKKRKAQGIFYTPQYVVRYIIHNTIGRLLSEGAHPADLRIVDPACGSGSFLIEAFDALDRAFRNLEPDAAPQRRAEWRKHILTECLYGVDLDEQAVEVTRLNLILRAALSRERLPRLNHIKHGNSLVSDPAVAGDLAFDWRVKFDTVFARGGFDAVIGNPPYVRGELLSAQFKEYAQTQYQTYAGQADLYTYFIERGVDLLRKGGLYSVIVANKWMRAAYGGPLRRWLKTHDLREIVNFGELKVFHDAATDPCIITLARNGELHPSFEYAQVKSLDFMDLEDHIAPHRYSVQRNTLDDNAWSVVNTRTAWLLEKLKAAGVPLGEYVNKKIYFGIKTGLNEAFIINETIKRELIRKDPKSQDIIKPYLFGRYLNRYETFIPQNYVIFTKQGIDISQYPAILSHLEQFKERLTPKPNDWPSDKLWAGRKSGNYKWYEIQDTVDYYTEFEKPKIIYPDITSTSRFTLDTTGAYMDATIFTIGSDSKYLLAILASKLAFYYIGRTAAVLGDVEKGGRLRLKKIYLQHFPIPRLNLDDPNDKAKHDHLVGLVEQMLALKQRLASETFALNDARQELTESIARVDAQIDRAVYALYGLTDDDIAVIEG